LPEWYPAGKRLVEAAFAHRRKTLPNSLQLAGYADRQRAAAALEQVGFPPATRAERLASDDFAALAEARGEDPGELADRIDANATVAFGLPGDGS